MATQRLNFLYPHLFKPLAKATSPNSGRACLSTSTKLHQQLQRHGTAVEPIPPIPAIQIPKQNPATSPSKEAEKSSKPSEVDQKAKVPSPDAGSAAPATSTEISPGSKKSSPSSSSTATTSSPRTVTPPHLHQPETPIGKELETVLHIPPPTASEDPTTHKPPHLCAPAYTHHFDTFTLVRSLESDGSFQHGTAVGIMKAVRGLLAANLSLARDSLVSKSDVENEQYLFRAASSELRTEIANARKTEADKMRTGSAQLQHEVDVLNQKLTQELHSLRDELKGMFDDRKMETRTEQRTMESAIQDLNYRITVSLNSDMKSEAEGLRWVLTRRAGIAIAVMVFLILGSLRAASVSAHNEEKKVAAAKAAASSAAAAEKPDSDATGIPASRAGDATYVSLG